MIPTAEEFLLDMTNQQSLRSGTSIWSDDAIRAMIEFAKLHCIEATRVISEKVEINEITEQQSMYLEDYFNGINKESILNAYSLDNIK